MIGSRPRGFVLILVLVALALVGTALASLALRVHEQQQATLLQLDRLQRTLVIESADAAVLIQEKRLAKQDAGVVAGQAMLGRHRVQLRWANENAKANLNVLRETLGREVFERELNHFVDGGGADPLDLDPKNAYTDFGLTASGAQGQWPAYASFDQFVDREEVAEELRKGRAEIGVFDRLTLWGSGRIYTLHADPTALALALRVHLPPREADDAAEVLAGQRVSDRESLRIALAEFLADQDEPGRFEGLEVHLAGEAETTSLRITVDDGRRVDTTLRLRNASRNSRTGQYELRW
ncbi:MAG: hypothetical protein AAGH99_07235 [Planctomycetota bacterium]